MRPATRDSGIAILGPLPWGAHFCQLFHSRQDLLEVQVPYFKAGLENNEFCVWVTSEPLSAEEAESALRQAVPDLDDYLARGQIEIVPYDAWYLVDGQFDAAHVLRGWGDKLAAAKQRGLAGLRLSGNSLWLDATQWRDFQAYEQAADRAIAGNDVIALCPYSLSQCTSPEIVDVVAHHQFALIKRDGLWEMIESAERRHALAALGETRARYESLFQNMIDGFAYHEVITDDQGQPVDYRFLEVNDAFERLTGLRREAVTGKLATEVLPGIERDPADWIGVYGRIGLTGEAKRFEQYVEPLSRWCSVMAYSPKPGHFATVLEDITDRKRAEEEIGNLNDSLNRHVRDLERANHELESFAYSVSHDLIAPLRSINGFSQILHDDYADQLNHHGRSILQRVRASSDHMARLIDALLELSRLTRAEPRRETVDFSSLARQVAQELNQRDTLRRVDFEIPSGLVTQADPAMLRSVLQNLLGNAWKFTRGREPARIQVAGETDGGVTRYCIRDNGIGFDMADAKQLFTAFHRLHDDNEYPGLGIGLATVHRIVQRHGGQVWAEARPGQGAAFWFTLQPA